MTRTPRIFFAVTAVAVAFVAAGSGGRAAHAASPSAACGDVATRPWCDASLSPDARAALLLSAMTVDERIRLLGGDTAHESPHTGASFAIPRLGIPVVYYSDGPVGPRQGSATAMPVPIALAASFNPTLAGEHGEEIATEAKDKGNDVVFAPTVNIARNPQNGRSYEAYGEEPYLTGQTTVGWIDGAQSTGVIADVKHFAAYNQEGQGGVPPITSVAGSRMLVNVQVDERTLRELYFPHFEAAVKQANVGTLMCSYNMVNGTYACENAHDLQQVLEKDWGYRGIVLADYGAAHNTGPSLTNGLDFEPSGLLPSPQAYTPNQINAALALGQASETDVDNHVSRTLRTMFAYGVFDRAPYVNDDSQINKPSDDAVAEKIEGQAITLLKNTNATLPLSNKVKSIAVIGPYADQFITGGGSGAVTPFAFTTALAGIKARAGSGVTVTYTDGSDQAAAAAAAKAADVAMVVVGDVESEGQDKSCIGLNCSSDTSESESVLVTENTSCGVNGRTCPLNGTDEDGLVSAVAAVNPHTVAVLETGAPVLTPWRAQVGALVEAWYPGQEGGTALAHMLFGDTDPGGRLPVTFPASQDQLPTAGSITEYPGAGETVDYTEGLDVGYRYYDAHNLTPAYPFGAGLSYTSFSYRDLTVAPATGDNAVATARVTVTNTGSRTGTAVPELYLSKPSTAALPQVVRQLEGYQSLSLAPGASTTVSFPLNARSFASWDTTNGTSDDPTGSWVIPQGCYGVAAGASSRDLPLTAQVGQGASCAGGVTLTTAAPALASLPLPANPTIVSTTAAVPKAARHAAKARTKARHVTKKARAPRQPTHTLAFTGGIPAEGWAGAAAVIGALALTRRRRRGRAR